MRGNGLLAKDGRWTELAQNTFQYLVFVFVVMNLWTLLLPDHRVWQLYTLESQLSDLNRDEVRSHNMED
jgi:hypothetical protein